MQCFKKETYGSVWEYSRGDDLRRSNHSAELISSRTNLSPFTKDYRGIDSQICGFTEFLGPPLRGKPSHPFCICTSFISSIIMHHFLVEIHHAAIFNSYYLHQFPIITFLFRDLMEIRFSFRRPALHILSTPISSHHSHVMNLMEIHRTAVRQTSQASADPCVDL